MQHIRRGPAALKAYHEYLQSDHDYRVWVDVLTLEQTYVDTLDLLDGQVNFQGEQEGPDRTGSVVLSDPNNALDFSGGYVRDPKGVLWLNRLVQIWHEVTVPGYGDFTTSVMVGVPTAAGRSGGEVSLELADKSLLADHGVPPRTFKMGMRVDLALRAILEEGTGEKFLDIPRTKKTLSRTYAMGMGENSLTPWQLFKRIAGQEKGWRAYYSGTGFATCEPASAEVGVVPVQSLLSIPAASTSFTALTNYSKVTSTRKPSGKSGKGKKKKKPKNIVHIHDSVVALRPSEELSPESLARNGVPRILPVVEVNDDLKNLTETMDKAVKNLKAGAVLDEQKSYEIIPLFHLEPHDKVALPLNAGVQRLAQSSIPLGTGGNMTVGSQKWVSAPVKVKRLRNKTTVKKTKKKGGKKDGE